MSELDPRLDDADLVIDFAAGLLDPQRRAEVMERASRDPEFEQLLRAQLELRERDRIIQSPIPGRRRRWIPRIVAAVAAAVLLALLLPDRSTPPGIWFPIDDALLSTRSGEVEDARLQDALEAYRSRDVLSAERIFRELDSRAALDDLGRLYWASALYNLEQVAEAAELVTQLDPATMPAPWRDYALRLESELKQR